MSEIQEAGKRGVQRRVRKQGRGAKSRLEEEPWRPQVNQRRRRKQGAVTSCWSSRVAPRKGTGRQGWAWSWQGTGRELALCVAASVPTAEAGAE